MRRWGSARGGAGADGVLGRPDVVGTRVGPGEHPVAVQCRPDAGPHTRTRAPARAPPPGRRRPGRHRPPHRETGRAPPGRRDRPSAGSHPGLRRGGDLGRRPAAGLGLSGGASAVPGAGGSVVGRAGADGDIGQHRGHGEGHRPDPTPPGRRRAPRHRPAGARRRGQRLRCGCPAEPLPRRWRGGVPGCLWCSWPSPPRSRAVRPTTTTTSAPGATWRHWARPSGGRCGAWCRWTASASGRWCRSARPRAAGPASGPARARPRLGPMSRRRRRPSTGPATTGRSCVPVCPGSASAARRTPATTARTTPRTSCDRAQLRAGGAAGRGVGGSARLAARAGRGRCCGSRRRGGCHGPADHPRDAARNRPSRT